MNKNLLVIAFILSTISCQNKPTVTAIRSDTLKPSVDTTKAPQMFEQICDYDSVSKEFNYKLSGYKPTGDENDDNHVSLAIYSKKDKHLIQTITFEKAPAFNFDCASYSFITGYHSIDTISDGIYGDLVTADFNFDGKEDFAVAFEVGFSEFYEFYLQENGKFAKNGFLTDSVGTMPEMDAVRKKLTTANRLGATRIAIVDFQYDEEKKRYTVLKSWVEDFDGNVVDSEKVFDEEAK